MSLSLRRRRWLAIAGGLVTLFTVFGFLIAPPILKSQLQKRLSLELGRSVTIDKIRLNPYALSLSIEGLAIKDRDGGPFVGWRRVYVNFDAGSFFVREWRFQEIAADAPGLRVIVNQDGTFNFSDLLAKFAAPAAGVAPAPEESASGKPITGKPTPGKPGWPLRIANLSIVDAALDFTDHSRSADFVTRVGPVSFVLRNFRTSPGSGAPYEFAATTEVGESLTWRGTLSASPLGSQGEFTLGGIKLPKYAPYYRDYVRFDLADGTLDIGGRYQLDLSGAKPRAALTAGTVHLSKLKVAPRGEKISVVDVDDFSVTGIDADAEKMSAVVGKVALTGGRIAARRAPDGSIDLVTLLTPIPSAPTRPAVSSNAPSPVASAAGASGAPGAAKPDVKIAELAVRKFTIGFEDHATPRVALTTIENVEFDAKNLSLAEGAEIPIRLALAFPAQGAVKAEGSVVLSPMKAAVDIEATNVAFANISPYIEPLFNLRIAAGTFSSRGRAGFALVSGAPPVLTFKGDVGIAGFSTVSGESNDEFTSWSALKIQGIDFASEPLAVSVEEIVWTDPAAHLIVNRDGSNNLASVLRLNSSAPPAVAAGSSKSPTAPLPPGPSSAPPQPAEPAKALPKITVAKISIANAAFTFADRSLSPAVSTAINQFGGTIAGLSSLNLARADVDLKATVDGVGPVAITGKLDPLGAVKFVDLKVDFRNVDLTPFSPYSGKFAGYELARGKLFLDVSAKLNGDKVDMENVVTLNQFTFGAVTNSPEATKLPVRLGVALLKDTEGKMVIDIPVAGSLGDPEFRIGRVVWRVIGNLLTKAATSPFSLLGAMFGGGGDELAFQDFGPGGSDLAPENLPKLATLTKALGARPGLNLEIAGSFDSAADSFALKHQLLAKQLRASLWEERRLSDPNLPPPEQLVISPEEEGALVRKQFNAKFPPGTEFGAPLPVAPSPTVVPQPPPKRTILGRVVDVVTFKSRRAERPAETKPTAAPAISDSPSPGAGAGPTVEEMKLRLADTITVADDDLRQLATARAQRVRDHFLQAQIAPERLFLVNEPAAKGSRVILQLQ